MACLGLSLQYRVCSTVLISKSTGAAVEKELPHLGLLRFMIACAYAASHACHEDLHPVKGVRIDYSSMRCSDGLAATTAANAAIAANAPIPLLRIAAPADTDCVALLCAMGALQQKPRAQHFGPFLQHFMPRLQQLSREQLVAVLEALAVLQLSTTDTQVGAAAA